MTDRVSNPGPHTAYTPTVDVQVDNTAPTVALSGPLKDKEGQSLTDGIWDLTASASDTGAGPSGVASVDVTVDGQPLTLEGSPAGHIEQTQPCDSADCALDEEIPYDTKEYPEGQRTVTAVAHDFAGNASAPASFTFGSSRQDPPCQSNPTFTPYHVGDVFETLPMNMANRMCASNDPVNPELGGQHDVSYLYGNCPNDTTAPVGGSGCLPPIEIVSAPLCEAHAALYTQPVGNSNENAVPYPHTDLTVRGVPAASFNQGTILEVYTGSTTVSVIGGDSEQVRRAADLVRLAVPAEIPGLGQTLTQLAPASTQPLTDLPPPDPVTLASGQPCK